MQTREFFQPHKKLWFLCVSNKQHALTYNAVCVSSYTATATLSCSSLDILHYTAEQKPHFAGTTVSLHV